MQHYVTPRDGVVIDLEPLPETSPTYPVTIRCRLTRAQLTAYIATVEGCERGDILPGADLEARYWLSAKGMAALNESRDCDRLYRLWEIIGDAPPA